MEERQPLLIDGLWLHGGAEPIRSINPANGVASALVSAASETDVDRAVASAARAYRESGWRDLLPHQRADKLHTVGRLLAERAEEIGCVVMHENGKTLRECTNQVRAAAGIFRYYASVCETMGSEVTPPRGEFLTFTLYEPYGVVAALTPWNSPVNINAEKLGPALAAGNSVRADESGSDAQTPAQSAQTRKN